MSPKMKTALAVVGLVIFIAGAGVLVFTQLVDKGPKPPEIATGRAIEKIDLVTLDVMTKTIGEWQNLGEQNGKSFNPDTNTYTMVIPINCAACGKKIPSAPRPDNYDQLPDEEKSPVMNKIDAEYVCPKCGKRANR